MSANHIRRVRLPRLAGLVALTAFRAVTGFAASAGGDHHVVIPADEMKFDAGPPTLPPGAEIAVLLGSPAEEGPFVIRLKFPADYEVPPHFHSKEEHVTVISGAFGMSTGKTHDRAMAPLLPEGSFVRIPAGEPHFAWTDRETVVQLNGVGPFGVEYVNAEDDPRTQ